MGDEAPSAVEQPVTVVFRGLPPGMIKANRRLREELERHGTVKSFVCSPKTIRVEYKKLRKGFGDELKRNNERTRIGRHSCKARIHTAVQSGRKKKTPKPQHRDRKYFDPEEECRERDDVPWDFYYSEIDVNEWFWNPMTRTWDFAPQDYHFYCPFCSPHCDTCWCDDECW